jgi:porin
MLVAAIVLAAGLPSYSLAAVERGGSVDASEQSKPDAKAQQQLEQDKTESKTDNDKSEKPPGDKDKGKGGGAAKSDDIWQREMLFGDLGGLRPELEKYGMKLGLMETSEILGNPTGGRHRGVIYEGLTDLNLNVDLRPTLGLPANIFARAYQIHGRGLSPTTGVLDEISGIEASATTRLVELWYEQQFGDWLWLRLGQQTIGTEFLNPEAARLFVNGAFGWPTLAALDLPSGGPGFPLGTPAVRARIEPEKGLSLFLALFNGDPTGAGVGGSQLADASGTAFRIGDGAFVIGELRYNPDGSDQNGTYGFGAWFNSERFRDLRIDTSGLSLASPLSNGMPRLRQNDYSLYALVNQPFLTDPEAHTGFAAFARIMGAPGDRNLVEFYVDGGLTYKGPFGRADDQAGIAIGYARVGGAARALDADIGRFNGVLYPVRSGETVLELTYQFQIAPWWQVQPDFQYIFNPGGGLPDPSTPTRRLGDAAVMGVRTAITF